MSIDCKSNIVHVFVEYNVHEGAVMVPKLFYDDFGHEITRFVDLIDSNGNQFEVLVDRVNENLYFTRGWAALRDFYDIRVGGWVLLMYTGIGSFGVIVQDRLHQVVPPPAFVPPAKFVIDKLGISPFFVNDLPASTQHLAYSHDESFFFLSYEKKLTYSDISSGFLILAYDGFSEYAFNETTTSIKLVDECGNAWNCDLIFVTFPSNRLKVGSEWSRLVSFRRFGIGEPIRVGVQDGGDDETLYLTLDP